VTVTIAEAVSLARRQFLAVEGIVGVGRVGNTIVFYVETEADRAKVPPTFMGYPTAVRVVGRVRLL